MVFKYMEKHYFKNLYWLASRQIIREQIYTVAQFFLSIIFAISVYLKIYYFFLPDIAPDIGIRLSGDILSTTLLLLIFFSAIIFILISLIFNKHRTKTFGIIRGIGGRKSFIFFLLLIENIIILIIAFILGLMLSFLFINPTSLYLERLYSISVSFDWSNLFFSIFITLLFIIVLSVISTLLTSLKTMFTDPYEIIRSRE